MERDDLAGNACDDGRIGVRRDRGGSLVGGMDVGPIGTGNLDGDRGHGRSLRGGNARLTDAATRKLCGGGEGQDADRRSCCSHDRSTV